MTTLDQRAEALTKTLQTRERSFPARLFLLIDPALRPVGNASALGKALAECTHFYVDLSRYELDLRLMPYLVEIDPQTPAGHESLRLSVHEALEECSPARLKQGQGRRIGGWLESSVSGQTLAEQFARHVIQTRKSPIGRTTRHLFRWYDPAVLWALWPLLSSRQQATLLGFINELHLLDPGQHHTLLTPPKQAQAVPKDLAMSAEQWIEIDHIAALNHWLRERRKPPPTSPEEWHSCRAAAMIAMARAHQYGFYDPDDWRAFALAADNVHPQFDRHPRIAERLKHRRAGDYVTGLLDDVVAAEWHKIRAELQALDEQTHFSGEIA